MATNAKLSVTYFDNIKKEEQTRFADVGIHPIHELAKKEVGYSMAYNIAKNQCGHEEFEIISYEVIDKNE